MPSLINLSAKWFIKINKTTCIITSKNLILSTTLINLKNKEAPKQSHNLFIKLAEILALQCYWHLIIYFMGKACAEAKETNTDCSVH